MNSMLADRRAVTAGAGNGAAFLASDLALYVTGIPIEVSVGRGM